MSGIYLLIIKQDFMYKYNFIPVNLYNKPNIYYDFEYCNIYYDFEYCNIL